MKNNNQKIKFTIEQWLTPEDLLWVKLEGENGFANGTPLLDSYDVALKRRLSTPLTGEGRQFVHDFALSHGFIIYKNKYHTQAEMGRIYEKAFKSRCNKLNNEQELIANDLLKQEIKNMPKELKKEVKAIIKNEQRQNA